MDEVVLTFKLQADLHLSSPRAHTAHGWLTFGFDPGVSVAARNALDAMISLIAEQYRLARVDAMALASLVVDLRITQIVNQVCGVHAVLPHGAIQQ
jgi:acetamidase/formamidase